MYHTNADPGRPRLLFKALRFAMLRPVTNPEVTGLGNRGDVANLEDGGYCFLEDQFWGRAALQRAREQMLTGACYLAI
jgi:hypothetical protein